MSFLESNPVDNKEKIEPRPTADSIADGLGFSFDASDSTPIQPRKYARR